MKSEIGTGQVTMNYAYFTYCGDSTKVKGPFRFLSHGNVQALRIRTVIIIIDSKIKKSSA
jgi:hypothetical protein